MYSKSQTFRIYSSYLAKPTAMDDPVRSGFQGFEQVGIRMRATRAPGVGEGAETRNLGTTAARSAGRRAAEGYACCADARVALSPRIPVTQQQA
jgi:hypothetical protein